MEPSEPTMLTLGTMAHKDADEVTCCVEKYREQPRNARDRWLQQQLMQNSKKRDTVAK